MPIAVVVADERDAESGSREWHLPPSDQRELEALVSQDRERDADPTWTVRVTSDLTAFQSSGVAADVAVGGVGGGGGDNWRASTGPELEPDVADV